MHRQSGRLALDVQSARSSLPQRGSSHGRSGKHLPDRFDLERVLADEGSGALLQYVLGASFADSGDSDIRLHRHDHVALIEQLVEIRRLVDADSGDLRLGERRFRAPRRNRPAAGAQACVRKAFRFKSLPCSGLPACLRPRAAEAALPKAKITRVRIYKPPDLNELFNQSNMIMTVEADIGITGIGEGGSKDILEQCAGTLIGKNPSRSKRSGRRCYPTGREKIHAVGAMDLALWDIKGKTPGLPVHELLGGAVRNHCECYAPVAPVGPRWVAPRPDEPERARPSHHRGGLSGIPYGAAEASTGGVYNTHERVRQVAIDSKVVREGVGKDGDWCIDFHQRFDYNDTVRACKLIEEYEPYFVEDPVRDEHAQQDLPLLRRMTTDPHTR